MAIQLSSNLSLSPFKPEDAPELFRLVDQNRSHLRQWLAWLDKNLAEKDSAAFIEFANRAAAETGGLTLAIRESERLVGAVDLHAVSKANKAAAIGYWLSKEDGGRGLVTEAVRGLTTYAFNELKLERLELRCATENAPSRRVAERLGFTKEGQLRRAEWLYDHFVDHYVYSMLREEWQR